MRTAILAALVALSSIATPAFAETGRMSRPEFARANRCLAYAGLDALRGDNVDLSALQQRFNAAFASKPFDDQHAAKEEARRIRVSAGDVSGPKNVETLRAWRDAECRSFMTSDNAAGGERPAGG